MFVPNFYDEMGNPDYKKLLIYFAIAFLVGMFFKTMVEPSLYSQQLMYSEGRQYDHHLSDVRGEDSGEW